MDTDVISCAIVIDKSYTISTSSRTWVMYMDGIVEVFLQQSYS